MKRSLITNSLILAFSLTGSLNAQDGIDPFAEGNNSGVKAKARTQASTKNSTHTLVFETFSLPLKEAAGLIRSGKTDEQIYATLVKSAKQEGLVVLRGRSGTKAVTESVHELIYPTEFNPPKLPSSVTAPMTPAKTSKSTPQPDSSSKASNTKHLNDLATPATPSAFETRNVGIILEAEFILSNDPNGLCDMRIYPELTTYLGKITWGQGVSKTELIDLETQRFNTSISLRVGKPFLLGTLNRPPSSKIDGDLPNRIWFATVSLNAIPK